MFTTIPAIGLLFASSLFSTITHAQLLCDGADGERGFPEPKDCAAAIQLMPQTNAIEHFSSEPGPGIIVLPQIFDSGRCRIRVAMSPVPGPPDAPPVVQDDQPWNILTSAADRLTFGCSRSVEHTMGQGDFRTKGMTTVGGIRIFLDKIGNGIDVSSNEEPTNEGPTDELSTF